MIDPHCIPVIDLSHLFENQIAWKRVNSIRNRQISFFSSMFCYIVLADLSMKMVDITLNDKQSSLVYQGQV